MKIAIITDTNSSISQEEANRLGIFLVAMPLIIDDEVCCEGNDFTQEEFYENVLGKKTLSTSQPSPADVLSLWDKLLSDGYDEILHIPMSSGLSNTCQTAIMLSQDYEGKVFVVDNHRISLTLRESVLEAIQLANNGLSALEIQKHLEAHSHDSSIYIAVDTLEFLKKGGRITATAATLGAVLNIKPILTIQGEKLDAFTKVRGMKKCRSVMIDAIKQDLTTRFANVDSKQIRIATAGAGLTEEEADVWRTAVADAFPDHDVIYAKLPLSIVCHTGPGALGIGLSIVAE